jgi:hypothetical protein
MADKGLVPRIQKDFLELSKKQTPKQDMGKTSE